MTAARILLLTALASAAAGCNDEPLLRTPAERAFANSYADIACNDVTTCCTVLGHPGANEARCRAQAAADIRSQRAVGPSFSPARAARCLAELTREFQACIFPPFEEAAACFGIWNFGHPLGAPCDLDVECAAPGDNLVTCEADGCTEIQPAAEGEPCDLAPDASHVWRQCDEAGGVFCNKTTLACQRAGAAGASCADVPCAANAACNAISNGSCVPRGAEGEPCAMTTGENGCADGLVCIGVVCQPRAAAGESCAAGETCLEDAECNGGTCHGDRSPGQACDAATDYCFLGTCVGGHCALDAAFCL